MKQDILKISVITPSFNQGKYLEKTIQSVLNQNYPNLEYIIIDGGSTDNSVEIIKKYEDKLAYWVSEKDNGQADAINKGLKIATGDIICWLNSDDYYLPDTLEKVNKFFINNPEIDFVYGDILIANEKNDILGVKKVIPYDFKTQLFSGSLIPQPSSFWRLKVTKMVGLLNRKYNFLLDMEYFIRIGAQGFTFGIIKEPLAVFRLQKCSKTLKNYNNEFFFYSNEIKKNYVSGVLKHDNLLTILKYFYKIKTYFLRVIIRKDFIPYKNWYFRKKAQKVIV